MPIRAWEDAADLEDTLCCKDMKNMITVFS